MPELTQQEKARAALEHIKSILMTGYKTVSPVLDTTYAVALVVEFERLQLREGQLEAERLSWLSVANGAKTAREFTEDQLTSVNKNLLAEVERLRAMLDVAASDVQDRGVRLSKDEILKLWDAEA